MRITVSAHFVSNLKFDFFHPIRLHVNEVAGVEDDAVCGTMAREIKSRDAAPIVTSVYSNRSSPASFHPLISDG